MNGNGNVPEEKPGLLKKTTRSIFGAPKSFSDPHIFHKLALIPLLAWIGLGADGLSSSSYGPEEAFRALGSHVYLALFLGLATTLTVFIISYAYSRIIEHFPHGGGGYIVATHMLGKRAGVVSGSALIHDYILTISISIAACMDALFSFLPMEFHHYKLMMAIFLIILLIVMNIRGVKESTIILAPIFGTFVITHLFLILYGVGTHVDKMVPLSHEVYSSFRYDLTTIGGVSVLLLFLRAYSLGGGTYTGIEAVSNGLQIMREPRAQTGKRTMVYMATSLAFTATGLFICYLLFRVSPVEGRTLNSVLADATYSGLPFSGSLAFITVLSEGAILIVAAQAGFLDGPRIMANMAIDSWFPHRFAALSERLTAHNGILLMGIGSIFILLTTGGSVTKIVVMYSINVFLTFSLSEFGMSRFYIKHRNTEEKWIRHLSVHLTGLTLCVTILIVTVIEKFTEGGWETLLITAIIIGVCHMIRSHYDKVQQGVSQLDETLLNLPVFGPVNDRPLNHDDMTAIQLVSGYNGFGVHTLLSILTNFPQTKQIIFASVAVIDSGSFKGASEVKALEESVKDSVEKYVELARRLGFPADYRMAVGIDVVENAERLCKEIASEFPRSTVFTGQLTFRLEKIYHKMLHNETAFAIQRRLQWDGITTVILPIRVKV